jgi:2-iminoacetate synthase
MSFIELLDSYADFDFEGFFRTVTDDRVRSCLNADRLTPADLLTLLSPKAADHLEAMAQKARRLTIQHFGRTIQLYIPLYISNFCNSECIYCGFNRRHAIRRRKLTLAEIDTEARKIAATGMRHILVLTGEAPKVTPLSYLTAAVEILKSYFASISIEMHPMQTAEYARLKRAGVDGLTVYQEVYDRRVYSRVHLAGEKTDYAFRLEAPARGAEAGFRWVNVGALLGLADPRREAFFTALHAHYLTQQFLETEISISMPRINPAEGGFQPPFPVDDRTFVQFMTAFRLFLPRAGIPISTRERSGFRDHLMHLGATRLSAGSRTDVGGYTDEQSAGCRQFEISDERSVPEMVAAIHAAGLQPVYKDWELF